MQAERLCTGDADGCKPTRKVGFGLEMNELARFASPRISVRVVFALAVDENAKRLADKRLIDFERDFVLETGQIALRHGKYDRQDFERVVSATDREPIEGTSAIIRAYNYFLKNIDPERVDRNTIKSNVQFVCIDLTEGEDEQQIFDTLNAPGCS